ncbi:MAG: hypothetical protein QOH92_2869 [Chloroflexota bacterium]|jgi:hypothetical protein|nr:hypothetical protein [Chloroflexota bacterium]
MKREQAYVWIDGIERHLEDLKENAYEGASGADRQALYVTAFESLTPVAVDVLEQVNASLLHGTGEVSVRGPGPDGNGGQIGSWLLTWPELSQSSSRLTGKALEPVTVSAVFPPGFTHPHLVAGGPVNPRAESLNAWPMQVTSAEDAEQHRPVLWAIATAEVHDRIYQSTWRVIPQMS